MLLVAILVLAHVVLYFAFGSSKLLPVVVATFFATLFFAAPLASSSVRTKHGLHVLSRAGGKTLLFCFVWGSIVAAAFVALLQLWQAMGASAPNYIVAMATAGLFCAVAATIPAGRQRGSAT